jgi:hypothetical protein
MTETSRRYKVVVPIGCRSDRGLTEPIVEELEQIQEFDVATVNLVPDDLTLCRMLMISALQNADIVVCVADRKEMLAAAMTAWERGVPIAHVYAGILNTLGTKDDIARHMITLMSDIQFCESSNARNITISVMQRLGLKPNAHDVGITHFDKYRLDDVMVMDRDYRVVLYNPVTRGTPAEAMKTTMSEIRELCMLLDKEEMFTFLIGPNPDMEFDFSDLLSRADVFHPDVPRDKFLGLLAWAKEFITNSSAGIYEAPIIMKRKDAKITYVGIRNRGRSRGKFRTGASRRIAVRLRDYVTSRFMEEGVETTDCQARCSD